MGGSIGVTIREENGTEHRMCRWTNSLPGFVHNIRFINKDKIYIKEYLELWYNMRKDWEENKDNKDLRFLSNSIELRNGMKIGGGEPQKFRLGMTDVYAPYPYLAPMNYGLIVIDLQNNVILHSQDYCGIGSLIISRASVDKEHLEFIDELRKSGRIVSVTDLDNKKVSVSKLDLTGNYFYDIKIDLAPFIVKRFGKSKSGGINNLKKEVIKLGFSLTIEEEEMWEEFRKDD